MLSRVSCWNNYKFNRKNLRKPVAYQAVNEWLKENYKCYEKPYLEGDDCLGILATSDIIKGEKLVVSKDKDLKIITFQENDNGFNIFSNMNITPTSISFYGNLNGNDSLEFISYEYDLLVNFFNSNDILTLLSSWKVFYAKNIFIAGIKSCLDSKS